MNNRRNFLINGALATSAMMVLKPLQSIARTTLAISGTNSNKLVLLHTSGNPISNEHDLIMHIKDIKKQHSNAILLNACHDKKNNPCTITYDACMNDNFDLSLLSGDYKIIDKGNIRTGIIYAKPGEQNVINKIKTLSTYLKKDKNCTVVVCLSGLGYKNKNSPDDLTLAEKTTHLDMIIGGHTENFKPQPYIALNSNHSEVIIHAATGDRISCGKIEIDFDAYGRKNQVSFSDHA